MNKPQLNSSHRVESSIDINAPKIQAWNVLRDFTNVSWAPGVKRSHGIGKSEMGIGAGRHCVLEGFGAIDEYITHWSEETGFAYSVTPLGPLHNAKGTWWLEETGAQSCRLIVSLDYDIRFGLFGQFMHKFIMRNKLETSLPQTTAAVKDRVENHFNTDPQVGELAVGF